MRYSSSHEYIYFIVALIHFASRSLIGSPHGEGAVADWLKTSLYVLSIARGIYFHWRETFVFVSFSLVEIQAPSLDFYCFARLIPGVDDLLTNQT